MRGALDGLSIPEALEGFADSEEAAVICGGESVTYRDLLRDAKQIAHALIHRGLQKGDRVVLDVGRSCDAIRMYLGVVFAGGVQVTIHEDWPDEQRGQVIADCAPFLIADDGLAAQLLRERLPKDGPPLPTLEGNDPFELVYTSGSTGAPKGVVNCHCLPVGTLTADGGEDLLYRIHAGYSRMLMDASLAFAVSDVQLFLCLFHGKTLVLAGREDLKSPADLAACMERNRVDALYGVGSRYGQYLADPSFARAVGDLSLILVTGERASMTVLDALQRAASKALLVDIYGSSEAFAVFGWVYREGEPVRYEPVGRPSAVLLSEDGRSEAEEGEVGEICIGSYAGESGRYWNDPERNRERYMEHPSRGRLFRTGDLAVREARGSMRIVGRRDNMVKLRGLRIELEAVERAMEGCPGVESACAIVDGEGVRALLCGFYSGKADEGTLRRFLVERLPYYMVPAILQRLDELPRGANGKLDRGRIRCLRREAFS